jgi:Zn-finger nucleic acid-binding protein
MIDIHYVEDVLLAGTPLCGEQKPQGVTSAIEAVTCQECRGVYLYQVSYDKKSDKTIKELGFGQYQ